MHHRTNLCNSFGGLKRPICAKITVFLGDTVLASFHCEGFHVAMDASVTSQNGALRNNGNGKFLVLGVLIGVEGQIWYQTKGRELAHKCIVFTSMHRVN